MHITLLTLGLAGLILSVYMARVFIAVQRGRAVRCVDGACGVVMKAPDARVLGFPNIYLAIPFYLLLVVFAVSPWAGHASWLLIPVSIASALSLAMSLYLTYSLTVKLKRL